MEENILLVGHFEYHFKDKLENLFDERTLEVLFDDLYKDNPQTDLQKFLRDNLNVSKLPIYKKDSKVEFKYGDWKELSPDIIEVNKNTIVSFKLFSDNFSIIQILKDDVTFKNKQGEIITQTLSEGFHLYGK